MSSKAQCLIERLENVNEIGRIGGNVLRNTVAYEPIAGHIIRAPIKGIARRGGVGALVNQHKAVKDRIRSSSSPTKSADINRLEQHTIQRIAGHVAQQQGHDPSQGVSSSHIRRAKRALYGTVFGTRVF